MKIFSGWYNHTQSHWPKADWVGYAINNHINWCRSNDFDYNLVASPMLKWSKLCHDPWSWAFGTFIKFEAMKVFLDNEKFGDIFFWIDLDIAPTCNASPNDLLNIGSTVLFAPLRYKHNLDDYDGYQCAKMFWSGLQNKTSYNALNTCLFVMSRQNIINFLNWMNSIYSMDTIEWWNYYKQKKINIKNEVDNFLKNRDNTNVDINMVGTEEMLIEDWLHQNNIQFNQYPLAFLTSPDFERPGKYVHYYGSHKQNYPK